MPKTKDFNPLWPDRDYVAPMPSNAGNFGGTKGGADLRGDAAKETSDAFGPKVTTVELAGGAAKRNDKITTETFKDKIATTTVRKPTRGGMKG
jgi:hypothetical protein